MPVVIVSGATGSNTTNILWQQKTPIVTAGSQVSGYPAINVIDPNTWNSWRSGTSIRFLTFDFGTQTEIDSVGVSNHNMFSSGTTFRISYSNNDVDYTTLTTYTLTSDDDLIFLFSSVTARYWRFTLPSAQANIGVIVACKRLRFPSPPLDDYTPLNYARQYTKLRNESIRGQLLGNRVIAAGAETSAEWNPLSRAWVDSNIIPFKNHYDQGGTFFYASCPSKYPLDMGYCWSNGEESTVDVKYIEGSRLATVGFSMRSYVAQ